MGRLLSLLAATGSLSVRSALATEGAPAPQDRWFGRVSTLAAIYHSSATIATSAGTLPGATVTLDNNVTLGFDVGYHIKRNLTAMLALGIPPNPTITGEGSVAALGPLGRVRYGPAIVTLCYHPRLWKGFGIYAGPGTGYAIILKEHDAAVSQLDVHNNWGSSSRPESSGASPESGTSTPTSSTSGSTSMRTGSSPVASPSRRA